MKGIFAFLVVLALIGAGSYYFLVYSKDTTATPDPEQNTAAVGNTATTTDETNQEPEDKTQTVIGQSVDGRDITAYHFGEGEQEVLFVGGIHGGYSWNTALLGYEIRDYLQETPDAIPEGVKVTVIPVLNPDGLFKTVGMTEGFTKADVPSAEADTVAGRFNAHTVDLNRNFDCDWKSTGKWQNQTVDGGDAAFSEPESQAIKNYIEANTPAAAVVYYSAAGGVFASNCHNGVLPETTELTNEYAQASGYKAYKDFDFYTITGDMVNWLAKEQIPAISVLLTNHTDVEWTKNKKGVDAVLAHFAQ